MKIAFLNIQNLFFRHQSLEDAPTSRCVRNWMEELDVLIRRSIKKPFDQERIRELSLLLGFQKKDRQRYARLSSRGTSFYLQKFNDPGLARAFHNNQWNGWVPVANFPIDPTAIRNKARLIAEEGPDILVLQEVEDRQSLLQFNREVLTELPFHTYENAAVLQGNDPRGLEQALLFKSEYWLRRIDVFTDSFNQKGERLFDKNFAGYQVQGVSGEDIWILAAQLGEIGPDKESSDEIRLEQGKRIKRIYLDMLARGIENIIVVGTFNAASYCFSLTPLLRETNLTDIARHPLFRVEKDRGRSENYHSLGAYAKGVNTRQQDYLLLSPGLLKRVQACGLNRKGVWPGKDRQWPVYWSLKEKQQQASAHPMLWVELDN